MATDVNKLVQDNFVRFVVITLLICLASAVCAGIFTSKHVKVFFIEFNEKEVVQPNSK